MPANREWMHSVPWRTRKRTRLLVGAVLGTAALAVAPAALASVEPNGGSGFDSGTDGWQATDATCQPNGGDPGELCSATNAFDPAVGNPGGSLRSRLSVQTGLLLFDSGSTWRSPSFTIPGDPGGPVTGAQLSYDRSFDVGALSALDPEADVHVALVDETAGGQVEPLEETLDVNDDDFETRTGGVVSGGLVRGHTYHVQIQADVRTTRTQSGGVSGSSDVHFDNVHVDIPDPSGNSPGVTFHGPPKSNPEIRALILNLDLHALAGDGPGGSLVPRDQCTILGTPGGDRIRGTTGNDVICGLGGNDGISGRGGRDVIDTGDGSDRASGRSGGDLLLGLKGKDRLKGGNGKDRIGGGAGRDKLFGRGNADLIAADDGRRDEVHGGAGGSDRAWVDRGRGKRRSLDRLSGLERITRR